jgi:hypothetical protein
MKIKTDSEGYLRDEESNALINTDANAFALYKQRRELKKINNSLESEITYLKGEMSEMKQMLALLIKQNNKETQ